MSTISEGLAPFCKPSRILGDLCMLVSKILRVLITVHGLVRFKLPPDATAERALPEAVADYHRVAMHAHVIGILTVVRVFEVSHSLPP